MRGHPLEGLARSQPNPFTGETPFEPHELSATGWDAAELTEKRVPGEDWHVAGVRIGLPELRARSALGARRALHLALHQIDMRSGPDQR